MEEKGVFQYMHLQKEMHGRHQTKKSEADKHDRAHRTIELHKRRKLENRHITYGWVGAITGSENLSIMVTAMQPMPSTDMQLR